MANGISFEQLTENEKAIFYATKSAATEAFEAYFGQNGEQHKKDHQETLPLIRNFLEDRAKEQQNKNEFWEEVKKDISKLLIKAILALGFFLLLTLIGVVVNRELIIKLIGFLI